MRVLHQSDRVVGENDKLFNNVNLHGVAYIFKISSFFQSGGDKGFSSFFSDDGDHVREKERVVETFKIFS